MAKSRRLELGDNVYAHNRSIFNHCDVIGLQNYRIQRKMQNKGYYEDENRLSFHRIFNIRHVCQRSSMSCQQVSGGRRDSEM